MVLFDRTASPSASRRRANSSCPWPATSWTAWPKPGGSSRPGTVPTASSAPSACLPSPSTCSRIFLPGAADVDQLRFVVNPFPQSVEEHFCALMEHQVDMLLTYRLDEYESDSEFLSHIESATVGRERFLPVVGSALRNAFRAPPPAPTFPTAISPSPTGSSFRFTKKTPCELQSVYESSLSEGIVKMLEKRHRHGMGSGNAGERAIEAGHHPPHMGRPPGSQRGSGHQALSQQNRPPRRHRNLLESDPPVSIHPNARRKTIKKPGPS